ncbi:iron-containing alcohol dehydrogenase [Bacillus sp. M6-12]|uniref:iron-containing alcohol dehydrogenase n=1 Tax=Bacillus sp. M6-12 TaxID=2054166 RepID=UPI0015E0B34D|nr:iron-containing alcohol dehydrogenase [Bacillus sp. M6-12]
MNLAGLHSFNCPTEIVFGCNSIQKIPEIILKEGFKRVLIICDEGIENAQILDLVLEQVQKSGVECNVFSNVEANPSTTTIEAGMKVYESSKPDLLIGLGGGSPIDTAKAIGILATNGGSITDYEGIDKFRNQSLPLMAIPTTSGTASEVTVFTVITDPYNEYKLTVGGRKLAARWAIVDPELTLTLPPKLTASTGLDALVHAIESYTSKMAYPLSEVLALEAIRVISSNLRQAVFSGDNLIARSAMMYGSLVAGLAFNNTRLGNVHAMSHPLSAKFHVPHGIANSILLPHVMEYNLPSVPEKFIEIAKAMGEVHDTNKPIMFNANKAIEAVKKLAEDINIPINFSEYEIKEEDIFTMALDAMKSGNIQVNPRTTKIEDIKMLYKKTIKDAEIGTVLKA